jgi:protein disulfide-isomerase A3
MKFFAVLAALSFIANSFGAESDVLDLGDSDFNTRVAETETTLVMFYAPW